MVLLLLTGKKDQFYHFPSGLEAMRQLLMQLEPLVPELNQPQAHRDFWQSRFGVVEMDL